MTDTEGVGKDCDWLVDERMVVRAVVGEVLGDFRVVSVEDVGPVAVDVDFFLVLCVAVACDMAPFVDYENLTEIEV